MASDTWREPHVAAVSFDFHDVASGKHWVYVRWCAGMIDRRITKTEVDGLTGMEELVVGSASVRIPVRLVEDEALLTEKCLNIAAFAMLPEPVKSKLKEHLPKGIDATEALRKLFGGKAASFGMDPVKKFCRDAKVGKFSPGCEILREEISKISRMNAKLVLEEHLEKTARRARLARRRYMRANFHGQPEHIHVSDDEESIYSENQDDSRSVKSEDSITRYKGAEFESVKGTAPHIVHPVLNAMKEIGAGKPVKLSAIVGALEGTIGTRGLVAGFSSELIAPMLMNYLEGVGVWTQGGSVVKIVKEVPVANKAGHMPHTYINGGDGVWEFTGAEVTDDYVNKVNRAFCEQYLDLTNEVETNAVFEEEEDDDAEEEDNLGPLPGEKPTAKRWGRKFHLQERRRYLAAAKPFVFSHGKETSTVGPAFSTSKTKSRQHTFLRDERPPPVTIVNLTRDAAARLPKGVGTRADICWLVRDSQYLAKGITHLALHKAVSGALDRLHLESDPCLEYDSVEKVWKYLHKQRDATEWAISPEERMKKKKKKKKKAEEEARGAGSGKAAEKDKSTKDDPNEDSGDAGVSLKVSFPAKRKAPESDMPGEEGAPAMDVDDVEKTRGSPKKKSSTPSPTPKRESSEDQMELDEELNGGN